MPATNPESAVVERYAAGAKALEPTLCCPVDYDRSYLEIVPKEVIERDYGCGDPSKHVREGETVLDLGSGTGKICFIASQVVGPKGRVIGIDMTEDMLEVARRNAPVVAERAGFSNVEFRKGRIQDLRLDLEKLDAAIAEHPVGDSNSFLAAQELAEELRVKDPMISDNSIDVVVSNCVLNLVGSSEKKQLFHELHRVLKPGSRAVISDIVSDEDIPAGLQDDPELWSGCISGAFREDLFLEAFAEAGFHGVRILEFGDQPWQTVEGIEFRSVTVEAFKGEEKPHFERNQAVLYKGPFKCACDDDGHMFERGMRTAVSDRTFERLQAAPYADSFEFLEPREEVPVSTAVEFDPAREKRRDPRETKGANFKDTTCEAGSCCC